MDEVLAIERIIDTNSSAILAVAMIARQKAGVEVQGGSKIVALHKER